MSSVNIAKISEAGVRRVAGHQTHAVCVSGFGEMTHCSPLVLFRVVDKHVSKFPPGRLATCSAGVKITIHPLLELTYSINIWS